jgi:putative peptidoglycan lipid II flippase
LTLDRKRGSYWGRFREGSINRQIFSAAVIIGVAALAVKVIAVVKDSVMVGQFGLGDQLDALLIALVVPTFATSVIAGSFNAAFLPAYIRTREQEGPAAAKRLFANIMVLDLVVLTATVLMLAILALPVLKLVAWEFAGQKLALAHQLFLLLLPIIVLEGQVILWGAVLNADEKFALAAWSPALSPLLIIIALFLLVPILGIKGVAWATVAGFVAELTVLGWVLARRGLFPVPRWHSSVAATKEVYKNYLPIVSGAVMMSSTPVIDQAMASWLASGSVAALSYGSKVPASVCGLGVTALGTAVFPYFSRLVALKDYSALKHTLRTFVILILAISVPATLLLISASEWIVKLLFERGSFTAEDSALVTYVQQMYSLQIPFFLLGIFGVRILNAFAKNYWVMGICIVNLVVNVVGNFVFMRWFGVGGIALSTSVVYMVSMSVILFLVFRILSQATSTKAQAG